MKQMIIEGNKTLTGSIKISGDKNSAVALVPASILSDEEVEIDNVPNISDIDALKEILDYLGAKVTKEKNILKIDPRQIVNKNMPEEISAKLRASYYFMSALLGKYKRVEMYFPGGCRIGARPIDQTLKAYKCLGAEVIEKKNKYTITAKELIGGNIELDMPSVGATMNAILVAVKAKGITTINNAAKEPQIVNTVDFLNEMGAKITGAGTQTITIEGVEHLGSAKITTIPDRIEAGTYLIAGALVGKNIKIENINLTHIRSLINELKLIGYNITEGEDFVQISETNIKKAVSIKTAVYPGFVTDLQQPMTVLLTQCQGESHIEETLYENRFKNIEFLNKMGAKIFQENNKNIRIEGPTELFGTEVTATDLRAGACLVLAGLLAKGTTTIKEFEHVLRGYENIVEKLKNVGANVKLEEY